MTTPDPNEPLVSSALLGQLSPEESALRIKEAGDKCDLAKLEAECRTTRETINKLRTLKGTYA